VEDHASLDLLSSFGCDIVQGYLISKPKPAGELSLESDGRSSTRRPALGRVRDRETAREDQGGTWGYKPLPSSGNP
jgi:predicted signal transduction protein with EAL and GGDEF domain